MGAQAGFSTVVINVFMRQYQTSLALLSLDLLGDCWYLFYGNKTGEFTIGRVGFSPVQF